MTIEVNLSWLRNETQKPRAEPTASPWRQVNSHLADPGRPVADMGMFSTDLLWLSTELIHFIRLNLLSLNIVLINLHFMNSISVEQNCSKWSTKLAAKSNRTTSPNVHLRMDALKCLKIDLMLFASICMLQLSHFSLRQRCVPTVYAMKLVDESELAAALDVTCQCLRIFPVFLEEHTILQVAVTPPFSL